MGVIFEMGETELVGTLLVGCTMIVGFDVRSLGIDFDLGDTELVGTPLVIA